MMLRPSNSLLGSSRAAQRASLRAERLRFFGRFWRGFRRSIALLFAAALDLLLLCGLPLSYVAAAYLALDVPARWMAHKNAYGRWGTPLFFLSLGVCGVGIARAAQNAEPIAPVRPKFAKAMFALSFVAALLFTITDLIP